MSSITMDERHLRRLLGDRASSLRIRLDGLWWRASWGSRRGATATSNGLLEARGASLGELVREIIATDEEDAASYRPLVLGAGGAS